MADLENEWVDFSPFKTQLAAGCIAPEFITAMCTNMECMRDQIIQNTKDIALGGGGGGDGGNPAEIQDVGAFTNDPNNSLQIDGSAYSDCNITASAIVTVDGENGDDNAGANMIVNGTIYVECDGTVVGQYSYSLNDTGLGNNEPYDETTGSVPIPLTGNCAGIVRMYYVPGTHLTPGSGTINFTGGLSGQCV